jgi:tetratricopeptide (TPR) repeat protein
MPLARLWPNQMARVATTENFRKALRARDRAEINRLAACMLDERTPLGAQWFSVAHVLVSTGEVALAISAAERGAEEGGGSDEARFQLAHILSIVGRQEDAIAIASEIPPGKLNSVERDHFLGTCALETGDFELARGAFNRVVANWRGSGVTWLSLAALPPVDDAALLDELNAARPTIMPTSTDSRARWHYAKGTVLDRLGRSDEAFAAFAAGAELVRADRPFDPDADRREAELLAAEFDRAAIDRIAGKVGIGTNRPILVTGLPRSGTTLVEQILTSHSNVAGGDELPFGSILARDVGGKTLSKLEHFVSAHGVEQLSRLFVHLGNERYGEGGHFVDKSLAASRELGLLASALPEARIVWLRRDPVDCAWSCFRTFFSRGIEWSWSLTDIAAHFQAEDMLHSHWARVLGDRVLTLSYEELTADPAGLTRQILDHVGLDAEPAMDRVHRSRRSVTTASLAQVRQPIYRSSVGAADRYRAHLQPFIEAYQATAKAD